MNATCFTKPPDGNTLRVKMWHNDNRSSVRIDYICLPKMHFPAVSRVEVWHSAGDHLQFICRVARRGHGPLFLRMQVGLHYQQHEKPSPRLDNDAIARCLLRYYFWGCILLWCCFWGCLIAYPHLFDVKSGDDCLCIGIE